MYINIYIYIYIYIYMYMYMFSTSAFMFQHICIHVSTHLHTFYPSYSLFLTCFDPNQKKKEIRSNHVRDASETGAFVAVAVAV